MCIVVPFGSLWLIIQVAYLKDTIARKDEEIEQLQLLKDRRTQSNTNSERYGNYLLCHSSSTPGILSLGGTDKQGRRLSGIRPVKLNLRATSCSGNF